MNLAKKLRDLVNNNLIETNSRSSSEEDDYIELPTASLKRTSAAPVSSSPSLSSPVEEIATEPASSLVAADNDSLTPEAVYQMLSSLPDNLPMRVKRAAIRNAIQNQGKDQGVDVETILGEATWKKMQMTQQLKQFDEQHNNATLALNAQIDVLLKQRDGINQEFDQLRLGAINLMEQMDRVIQFLGTDLAGSPGTPTFASSNPGELPPHLREETAGRLLGIAE